MWDFNGENDATRHGRTGPGSSADLVKTLFGLPDSSSLKPGSGATEGVPD